MVETNYYAKVNYRGKEKDYRVVAEESDDIRIEYLDYNPERESDAVWVNNGKNKIVKIYTVEADEHKYYESLDDEWGNQLNIMQSHLQRVYGENCGSLGTDHYKRAWRLAVNEVNSKTAVHLFPTQKIRE